MTRAAQEWPRPGASLPEVLTADQRVDVGKEKVPAGRGQGWRRRRLPARQAAACESLFPSQMRKAGTHGAVGLSGLDSREEALAALRGDLGDRPGRRSTASTQLASLLSRPTEDRLRSCQPARL